ncbi:MAG: hypothetical protein HY689_07090 [Chloroflexi bacterium]|nr:hypothetical protein [Chloroflexota bacterium]
MDPQAPCCHHPACPARGQVGRDNIRLHRRKERRYRCLRCGQSFAATAGTVFFRLRTAVEVVTVVLTLRCHGCPIQAIVAPFGLDVRTVAAWQRRAGQHGQAVHQHLVAQGKVGREHVQADAWYVKLVGQRVGMALALAVPTRLWLGGVVSPQRDLTLITRFVQMVRASARRLALVVGVDGLSSYLTAFGRVFRDPVRTGRRGRPRLVLVAGFLLGQGVKQYAKRHVTGVVHRAVQGTLTASNAAVVASGGGTTINTAYIERLHATFRSALTSLVRRGRAIARQQGTLTAGMWLVGSADNFCGEHESLRVPAGTRTGRKWQERTPAMAAGLTGHRWSRRELLSYQVPLPTWAAPKRRGRPPKQARPPLQAVAV